jgi:hypothetical protein
VLVRHDLEDPDFGQFQVTKKHLSLSLSPLFFFFPSDAKFKPAARDARNGKQAGRRRRHGQHSAG